MEHVLFKSEEKKKSVDAAAVMRIIADKLEAGEIALSRGGEEVRLSIPETVTLELKVEEETSPGRSGVKKSLEIEIEWVEGQQGDPAEPSGEVSIS